MELNKKQKDYLHNQVAIIETFFGTKKLKFENTLDMIFNKANRLLLWVDVYKVTNVKGRIISLTVAYVKVGEDNKMKEEFDYLDAIEMDDVIEEGYEISVSTDIKEVERKILENIANYLKDE